MVHAGKRSVPKALVGRVYLLHPGILLDVNLLPAVLLKLHSLDSVQGNAAGQGAPPTDGFGSDGAVDDAQHRISVAGVDGGAEADRKGKQTLCSAGILVTTWADTPLVSNLTPSKF